MKKWNRLITTLVACFLFCTLVTVVVVEIYVQYANQTTTAPTHNTTDIPKPERETDIENFLEADLSNCFLESAIECTVECSNINDDQVSSSVNKLDFSECVIPEIKQLTLNEVYFTNNTVMNGWLHDLIRDMQELKISSSLLTEIGDSAFTGKPFESLNSLVIDDSKRIKVLRKHSLKASKLQTFSFRCSSGGNIATEFNALEHISNYLTTLQFNECVDDFISVRNITGTSVSIFNKLIEIDLRYNTFTEVLSYSFVDTPQLISLYLDSNNIKLIELNAFNGITSSLQLLSLKDNKLMTLTEGVFDSFFKAHTIDIQGNPWNCNCNLIWFRDFYIENIERYFLNGSIPFICTKGNYSEVDFCPELTTVTDSSTNSTTSLETTLTPSTTTVRTTESPGGFVYLNCSGIIDFKEGLNRIYSHTMKVRNGTITYNFYQISGSPNFEIKVMDSVGSDCLIWINSKDSNDYGCIGDIQETVILDNLNYGMTYTLCLLKESADTVTPFDCTSLTVPLEWKNSPWIINKYMPAVIGSFIGITLAIIIVTSIIMFYTIRQNPKLIKGNKRVVIVRSKSADALVMPNYDRQQYVPPSIYTNSEGYLTPRNKMYEKINERRFRSLNTITEKFYQDYHGTTPRHSRSTYTGFHHRRSVGSEVYEPPPLPPNHPSERPCSSGQSTLYKK